MSERQSMRSSRVCSTPKSSTSRKEDSVLTLHNIEGEVRKCEKRLAELEEEMINEMKKLGDKSESFYYQKMSKERKNIKKKVQQLNEEHKGICERLNQASIKKAKN